MEIEESPKKTRVPERRLMEKSLLVNKERSIMGDVTFCSVMMNAMRPIKLRAMRLRTGRLPNPLVCPNVRPMSRLSKVTSKRVAPRKSNFCSDGLLEWGTFARTIK